MLSPVTFTVAGTEVGVDGWSLNDADGGYDQCSGVMSEADYRKAGNPTQGATVAAWVGTTCLWAGRFAAPPQIKEGRAVFNALGYKEEAEKKTERLLLQVAGTDIWVPADSDPHLDGSNIPVYDHSRKIDVESSRGVLRFALAGNQGLNTGDEFFFVFYAEGVDLDTVKWTQTYNTADEFPKLDIRVQRANGPTGTATNVTTVALSNANNGSNQSVSLSTPGNDIINVGLHCNDGTFTPNANRMKWALTKIRVSSDIVGSADAFNGSDVIDHIGTELGWDVTGVDATTYDVLPFDWADGSWMDCARYVAELEDRYVRVGAPSTTGPLLEYDDWGATNWTVYQTDGADADLKPLELFNGARVWYDTSAGVRRSRYEASNPDPLATAGITNTYEYDLEDPQKNDTLATAVATKLAARFSKQTYAGQIEVVAASSSDGRTDPRFIRYGDTVTIADWGPAANQTLRVEEVSQDHDSVTLGVEQPVDLVKLLAHTHAQRNRRGHHRRRKVTPQGHGHWGG